MTSAESGGGAYQAPYGDAGPGAEAVSADRVGADRVAASDLREESFGQLLSNLSSDTSKLVRQEVALAQAELTQKAKAAGKGAGMFAGAAVMGLAMLGALTALLIVLIDLVTPLWVAALAITVLWGIVAAVLAMAGRKEIQQATPIKPEQTVETVKEDVSWAKTQAKSARK